MNNSQRGIMGFFKKLSRLLKKEPRLEHLKNNVSQRLSELNITPLLITHQGSVIYTSQVLQAKPKDWLGGTIFEVMLTVEDGAPYFIYYENEKYYLSLITPIGLDFSKRQSAEDYRNQAAQTLSGFVMLFLALENNDETFLHKRCHYTHNRKETNTIAYLPNLKQWYPIFQSKSESSEMFASKIRAIIDGQEPLEKNIAITEPS